MQKKETKKILQILVLLGLFFILPKLSNATDYTSTNFTVTNPVIDTGSSSSTSTNFGLGQSISQSAIGKSTSTNFQLWSGFQYYFKVNANVLTATPGNGAVDLSWTVPTTYLGIAISSYEVGVGTVSGSYVFTDRGNVTSYNQTGLTNGTQYYFRIKAKAASGLFLVYSNEATATPVAPTPPPPGGGGGYSPPPPPPVGGGTLILKGLAYPGSQVTVLKDGALVASTNADPGAAFNISIGGLNGSYNFGIYTTDVNGQRSPTYTVQEVVTNSVTITVDNIFLGPTIGLNATIIKKGDTLSIFGFTIPDSPVNVYVNSPQTYIEEITSSSTGAWTKAFNTSVLDFGGHESHSQAEKDNLLSASSNQAEFLVSDKTILVDTGECKRSDFNCDNRVNLTDFSILLFFWNQVNPSNAKVDINKDTIVDLVDFSILLYDWTG